MANSALPVFAGVDFDSAELFDTTDLEDASLQASRVLSSHVIKIEGKSSDFRSRMGHLALGQLSLSRLTWGAAVHVDPGALKSYYLLAMPVKGHACFHLDGRAVDVSPHALALISPTQRFNFEASDGYTQIVLRIERRSMERGMQALTGEVCEANINFSPVMSTDSRTWRAVEPLLHVLATRAQRPLDVAPNSAFDRRVEELLIGALLLQQPHALTERLLPSAPSGFAVHVRRAQTYMRDHLEDPLTVGQIAIACCISVRTLQAAFTDAVGKGPMQWLREQRLYQIREALHESADANTSVTATAMRFGFTHPGEFSKAYRRMFGETASKALKRRS